MYRKGKTELAHMSFHGWIDVIKQDLQCDESACKAFVKLFRIAPDGAPHGYMEACRVLAHTLKDKHKDLEDWRYPVEDWSRYLHKACEEAYEALDSHEEVQQLVSMQWTGGWKKHYIAPPHPAAQVPATKGSSSSWDKGHGKGKYIQKGLR